MASCCRWHSAGTYDQSSKTGGPFGTMRFKAEQGHGANNGIDKAIALLEPIKEQFPMLSHADFFQVLPLIVMCNFHLNIRIEPFVTVHSIQLAGVVAVEITGGPEVPFHPGRPVSDFILPPRLDMICYPAYCLLTDSCISSCYNVYTLKLLYALVQNVLLCHVDYSLSGSN